MAKTVPLRGKFAGMSATVDDADYETVSKYKWTGLSAHRSLTVYARTSIAGKTVYMHRMILAPDPDLEVDHIDANGLNNQRSNLRAVTHGQNISARFEQAADREFERWLAEFDAAEEAEA